MTVAKTLGHGFAVAYDDAGGTDFTTIGLVEMGTPPAEKLARVEGTALEDTLETFILGVEEHSEFSFTRFWTPGSTEDLAFRTAQNARANCNWRLTFSNGATMIFLGKISDRQPESVESKKLLRQQVTVQRTGAITEAAAA